MDHTCHSRVFSTVTRLIQLRISGISRHLSFPPPLEQPVSIPCRLSASMLSRRSSAMSTNSPRRIFATSFAGTGGRSYPRMKGCGVGALSCNGCLPFDGLWGTPIFAAGVVALPAASPRAALAAAEVLCPSSGDIRGNPRPVTAAGSSNSPSVAPARGKVRPPFAESPL